MEKELQRLEEGPEKNRLLKSLRTTLKKVLNWKTQGYDGMYGFTSIHDTMVLELSRFKEETKMLEWMTMEKTTLI